MLDIVKSSRAQARVVTLAEAVYQHASDHYDHNGWDYIVECWTLTDIAEIITSDSITTKRGAIRAIGRVASIWNDRRVEIEATRF